MSKNNKFTSEQQKHMDEMAEAANKLTKAAAAYASTNPVNSFHSSSNSSSSYHDSVTTRNGVVTHEEHWTTHVGDSAPDSSTDH